MAGQPRRRAVLLELQARATSELGEGATPLDYAEHYVAGGGTIVRLAADLKAQLGLEISRELVSKALTSSESEPGEAEARLTRARARGAHALAEKGELGLEEAEVDERDVLAQAKALADYRLRLAAVWNRAEFGQDKGVNVAISFNASHLDVLRARATMVAPEAQQLAAGEEVISSVDVVEG